MKRKVLVVDDNEDDIELLRRRLVGEGYEPHALFVAKPSVLGRLEEEIKKVSPDAIVVDGLGGDCYSVIERAGWVNPKIACVIFTGDEGILKSRVPGSVIVERRGNRHYVYSKTDYKGLLNFLEKTLS